MTEMKMQDRKFCQSQSMTWMQTWVKPRRDVNRIETWFACDIFSLSRVTFIYGVTLFLSSLNWSFVLLQSLEKRRTNDFTGTLLWIKPWSFSVFSFSGIRSFSPTRKTLRNSRNRLLIFLSLELLLDFKRRNKEKERTSTTTILQARKLLLLLDKLCQFDLIVFCFFFFFFYFALLWMCFLSIDSWTRFSRHLLEKTHWKQRQ